MTHKVEIAFDDVGRIDPLVRDALFRYFQPHVIEEMFNRGGTITLSISDKKQTPQKKKPPETKLAEKELIEKLKSLSGQEADFISFSETLSKTELLAICRSLKLSSPKDRTAAELAKNILRHLKFSDTWRAISGDA